MFDRTELRSVVGRLLHYVEDIPRTKRALLRRGDLLSLTEAAVTIGQREMSPALIILMRAAAGFQHTFGRHPLTLLGAQLAGRAQIDAKRAAEMRIDLFKSALADDDGAIDKLIARLRSACGQQIDLFYLADVLALFLNAAPDPDEAMRQYARLFVTAGVIR